MEYDIDDNEREKIGERGKIMRSKLQEYFKNQHSLLIAEKSATI